MLDPHEALHEALSDRYELEEVLGEGGMGTVYLARDRKHDRPVAIKTIHPDRTSEEVRTRFEREISITARLQHPHILPLLDSGIAGETLYYVMPLAEGESLRQRLDQQGRLPLEEALQIAREVASALEHAHRHDIVHRDIKPSNIMLVGGSAVVTDFGIAKAIAEAGGEHLTQTGLAIGSPTYMSPEQSTGALAVDGRSDIYSLGCVLYEMLAGEPPFTGSTPLELIARSIREEAPPLRSKVKGVPPEVERAVHKALAKAPEDRFKTAEAFAQALTGGREAAAAQALTAVLSGQEAGSPGFWSELRRRKVYSTGVLYALGAWMLVQVAETTFPYLGLSDQAITAVIVAAIVGFPLALALAWAFDLTRKGIRRTGPVDVGAVAVAKASRRNAVLGGVLVFALLAVGTATLRLLRLDRGLSASEAPMGLAVFPFRGVGPETGTIGEGIADLVAAAIDGTGGMRVADPNGMWLALRRDDNHNLVAPELDTALELTRRSRSLAALLGSVTAAGSHVSITARLYDASGSLKASFTESVVSDSLYSAVNRLAIWVVAHLWERDSLPSVPTIESLATSSADALQEYLKAVRSRRSGHYEEAQQALEEAIAIDSTFALAYLELFRVRSALLWISGRQFIGLREVIDKARLYKDRLSTRSQDRIEAAWALDNTDGVTAAALLESIIARDSLDIDALEALANTYGRDGWQFGKELDQILMAYDRVLSIDPSNETYRMRRAFILATNTRTASALDQAIAELSSLDTTRAEVRGYLAAFRAARADSSGQQGHLAAAAGGSVPVAAAALRTLRVVQPALAEAFLRELVADSMPVQHQSIGRGALFQLWIGLGRITACDSLVRTGTLDRARPILNMFFVASLLAGAGDSTATARAVAELEAYAPVDSLASYSDSRNVWNSGWALGAYHAAFGDTAKARAYQRALSTLPAGDDLIDRDWRGSLSADIEARLAARRGDLDTAEREARRAYDGWLIHSANTAAADPEAAMRFHLAQMLGGRGATEEAAALYRSQAPPYTWRSFYTTLSYERLGQLYDKGGDLEKAAEHYARFVELWKDADPELQPRVQAAQQRLNEIFAERG